MFRSFPILQKKHLDSLLLSGYSLFFISLVFAIRPLNSIAIAFLVLTGILFRSMVGKEVNDRGTRLFWISCFVFYFLYILSLFYTSNQSETFRQLQLKSSLIFVPLFLVLHRPSAKQLLLYSNVYIICLFSGVVICLVYAAFNSIFREAQASAWFYHALVSPFKQHAVLFSLLVFFALTIMVNRFARKEFMLNAGFHGAVLVLFVGFLFLLSSKLIITGFLFYLFAFMIRVVKNQWVIIFSIAVIMIAVAGVFITRNPVSDRFREIIEGDMSLISQPRFNQGTYFNGLQFRLLQWKNVNEILQENDAIFLGVSPGNGQEKLNAKYLSKDMYSGTAERGERGFLGYNTHNQFLESTLHLGLVGLTVFLAMVAGLLILCFRARSLQLSFTVGMLLAFCFTESVLETQYGLVVFTFFPLFFYYSTLKEESLSID